MSFKTAAAKAKSPIDEFVATIAAMGRNRAMFLDMPPFISKTSEWRELLEDLEMLCQEGVIVGLRTAWVRRVAVPIVQAQRTLQGKSPDKVDIARDLIHHCDDKTLRESCLSYLFANNICGRHHV